MKKNVLKLAFIMLAGLAAICVYLAFIPVYIDHVSDRQEVLTDPRINARESKIKRGDIFDRKGVLLAHSIPEKDGGFKREYPLGSAAAHVIGYYSPKHGTAGLEKSMARVLLGMEGNNKLLNLSRILGQPAKGNDITLTLDADLHNYVAGLLSGKKGAAVALNPATGEVLALASYPDYEPMHVSDYMNHSEAPLLNRALQGVYSPGSIFKIVTAAALLSELPEKAGDTINCNGKLEVNGFMLRDNAVHGLVDLEEAFAKSCNVAFGQYGLAIGAEKLIQQANNFGIGKHVNFPLPLFNGDITAAKKMDGPTLASSAIGQGEILISPMQAALLACAVANDGVIMKPYLVAGYHGLSNNGGQQQPEVWLNAMRQGVAAILKEEMVAVVRHGTGQAAAIAGITVAGKTGSAENPHGKSHAWFVGFAPADEPRVAVAVVLENAGSGGAVAAPLAREIIKKALEL